MAVTMMSISCDAGGKEIESHNGPCAVVVIVEVNFDEIILRERTNTAPRGLVYMLVLSPVRLFGFSEP